jgi:hypothetical protein
VGFPWLYQKQSEREVDQSLSSDAEVFNLYDMALRHNLVKTTSILALVHDQVILPF